jgi:NADPH:quinone reductase-like Zn-dependent oxidoreductase
MFLPCLLFFFPGNYTKGEHVAGCVHGGLDAERGIRGAYSEYVVQEASLVFRYPSTIPPESAATIPLTSITAALGLFHEMGLPLPPATSETTVLVWAGSTSVGQYAIQLAKAAGCFVITSASPARHTYLKELGADLCFDYKDPNVVSQIKQASKNSLAFAFDCISEKESIKQVCATLTDKNAQVVTVLPGISSDVPSNTKEHSVMMYTIFGREMHVFGQHHKAKPQDKEFAEKFYKLLSDVLLPKGLVKPNKVVKIPGGLNGVEDGFKQMMENKVAAEKLVYTLAETTKH